MSSHLYSEIAKLADDVRHKRIHNPEIIKQVTMVTGYAHLVKGYPGAADYAVALEKHMHALISLACLDHPELCVQSRRILESLRSSAQAA
jgi:hypothetical protein